MVILRINFSYLEENLVWKFGFDFSCVVWGRRLIKVLGIFCVSILEC